MNRIPRYVAMSLIFALLNISFVNFALANFKTSTKAATAHPVSTPNSEANTLPEDDPCSPKVTKKCVTDDLDTSLSDFNALKGDPGGFADQFFTAAGFDPTDDVTDAKTDLGNMSDTDFDNNGNSFTKLHKKFKKHHQQISSILGNPSLMALLHRRIPVKFEVVATGVAGIGPSKDNSTVFSSTQNLNRSFPSLKAAAARGEFAKNFSGLKVVVVPETTGATCKGGDGAPNGINDVIIAKAVAFLAEAVKEAIPDDTASVVPHVIAVVAWTAAKGAELLLDSAHSLYTECKTLQDGDKVDSDLESLKTSASSINTSVTGISTNVNNIKTTVNGINSHTDSKITEVTNNDNSNKTAIISEIDTKAGNTTAVINSSTTTITGNIDVVNNNVNNVNNNVTNVNNNVTNVSNKVTTVNNNVNTANTNITTLTDISLRLLIEGDLQQADNSTPLAIFETPGSKGGYLELVRTIVAATIANLAGSSASQANSFLAQGDSLKSAGNYKAAYAYYKKAYKSAAN